DRAGHTRQMDKQPRQRRRWARSLVDAAKAVAAGTRRASVSGRNRKGGAGDLAPEGPRSWPEALAVLTDLYHAGHEITSITVPFEGAPALWKTNRFGAPVTQGERFEVRCSDGSRLP